MDYNNVSIWTILKFGVLGVVKLIMFFAVVVTAAVLVIAGVQWMAEHHHLIMWTVVGAVVTVIMLLFAGVHEIDEREKRAKQKMKDATLEAMRPKEIDRG